MTAPDKPDPNRPLECPVCGRAASERELVMVPDAVRVLRAFDYLDPNLRQLIVDLVENIAADGPTPQRRS